jgi:hypothetical protein
MNENAPIIFGGLALFVVLTVGSAWVSKFGGTIRVETSVVVRRFQARASDPSVKYFLVAHASMQALLLCAYRQAATVSPDLSQQ